MIKRLFFPLVTIAVLLSACSDNDSFSSDRSLRLSFTKDTVRLDTLLATIPSSTYSFWVHNRSNDGIRLSNVRLERGNQSGFRANVDGTFLNPSVTGLEVRKGDSIRVFVEVTAKENSTYEPTLLEDNLLFTLESGVQQKVNLRTYSINAEKVTNLEVTSDYTLETTTPIIFYGNGIHVAKGATLTIKNTTLYFHDQAGITVDGQLTAEGVTFRGDRLDHMFDYLPYDRISGQWYSIVINPKAEGCRMTDCEIRNGYNGIHADSTKVELTNTIVHNGRGYGVYAHDSEVSLVGSQFSNMMQDCVSLEGCNAFIDRCTLAQFYPFSAKRGASLRFTDTKRPMVLRCTNTLVTGYAEDVIMGDDLEQEQSTYYFENCLLRTPKVEDEELAALFVNILWETYKDEIQGEKHFVIVDADKQYYDFTIKAESPAWEPRIGRAFAEKKESEETTSDTTEEPAANTNE
jgi:hypothetical protein